MVAWINRQIVDAPEDDQRKVFRKWIIFILSQALEDYGQIYLQESVETYTLCILTLKFQNNKSSFKNSQTFFNTLKVRLL